MSHPTPESAPEAPEQRLGRGSEAGLFSHVPQDELSERQTHSVGENVDWRAAPFAAGSAE